MKLEKSLYQKSYLFSVVFFILMLWGFWLTYFTRIFEQANYRMHLHGACLILWCLMLIVQPWLIRSGKVKWHRSVGKWSYLLVPLLVFTTIDLLKYKLKGKEALNNNDLLFIALVLNSLLCFIILYGLAIYHRKQGAVHARYMISTALPFLTPITDRIIHIFFPSWLQLVPSLDGHPIAPIFGFAMADLILVGLCIWDWRSHKRRNVFPLVLLLLLAYHFSVLNFYKYSFWVAFCKWFATI